MRKNEDKILIYYGCADRCISVAFAYLSGIINLLKKNKI
jgi:predicted GH43/DUF377 family glycosyl hydrolase